MADPRLSPNMSSNQYLVVNDDNDNVSQGRISHHRPPSEKRTVTVKEWVLVLVLFFVNLINYMDRYTIPGTWSFRTFGAVPARLKNSGTLCRLNFVLAIFA